MDKVSWKIFSFSISTIWDLSSYFIFLTVYCLKYWIGHRLQFMGEIIDFVDDFDLNFLIKFSQQIHFRYLRRFFGWFLIIKIAIIVDDLWKMTDIYFCIFCSWPGINSITFSSNLNAKNKKQERLLQPQNLVNVYSLINCVRK